MKSGKQRRNEIKTKRAARRAEKTKPHQTAAHAPRPFGTVRVNEGLLAPYNRYGVPDYVHRGFYVDTPFTCAGCGKEEIWTATQQKWWYEVAKGYVYSTAKNCRPCRRKEEARRAEARRIHLDGVAKKRAGKAKI
jgi:putative zinc ribbon protein